MLLKESIISKPIFEEKDASKLPESVLCRVTYPICHISEKNANKRVYEKDVWDKVLGDSTLKEMMDQRRLFGHAEHPAETQSDLQLTSHVIHNMWIDEATNTVYQSLDVLDTPMGRIVDSILRANCLVGVSTRAEGDLEESEDDDGPFSRVLPESYRYITTDFTADPSTFGALPHDVKRGVVSSIATEMKNEAADEGERSYARKLYEALKEKCEEGEHPLGGGYPSDARRPVASSRTLDQGARELFSKSLEDLTPEEREDVEQWMRESKTSCAKSEAVEWDAGPDNVGGGLPTDLHKKETYARELYKKAFKDLSPEEQKDVEKVWRKVGGMGPESKNEAVEYTIASLIHTGQLRECNAATMDGHEGVLTIKEGMIQIVMDGKPIDLVGVEVASVYPDGTIHVWAKEEAEMPEPIVVNPELPEPEMAVDGEAVVPGAVVPSEEELPVPEKKESKVDENDNNVDQLVAQIDELKTKIESGKGTPEDQAQLEALQDEVSKAGGEIPEGRIPVEGGHSDKLAVGNLLRKGDNEDWVISRMAANGVYVHPVGSFEKEQLVVWEDLPSYGFVKVSEGKVVESVTAIARELTDLKIREAIERAEREVAIETYGALLEKHKSSEMKIKMLVKKTVSERKKAAAELSNESAKHATGDKEVKALRAKLEEKAKVAQEAKAMLETVKVEVEKTSVSLDEARTSKENKIEELRSLYDKVVEQTKSDAIEEGKLVGTGIVVNEYVVYKLAELGISVGENTRALLDECMTLREVDDTLEKVTDVMRRSALHSGTVKEIRLDTPPVDSEQSKIDKDVEKAFEGM